MGVRVDFVRISNDIETFLEGSIEMNRRVFWIIFLTAILLGTLIFGCGGRYGPVVEAKKSKLEPPRVFLIEDFSGEGGLSSIGTRWQMFTDQFMGGVSTGGYNFSEVDGRKCISMKGDVSLENNGGFVQVALDLEKDGKLLDASEYKGVRLWVRGNGENYYVHFRTSKTWLPWQYYAADFETSESWQPVELGFDEFEGGSVGGSLNPDALKRIAIVGAWKKFEADISVSRIEFYR